MAVSKLYPHHISTNTLQKLLLFAGSSVMALVDPYRDDMVAVSGEVLGSVAARNMLKRMQEDPEGREILARRPIINSTTVDLKKLAALPQGSLGYEYISFMERNEITCDSRKPVRFVDDVELAYIIQRYREIHDLVHLLLGQKTNMLGEVVVKWVEAIQTGLPMCWGGAIFGPLRLYPKQRINYRNYWLPWALDCGHKSKFFMNIFFEQRWEQNIDDLRAEANIPPFPQIQK